MKELKNKDFLGELISGLALEKQEEKRALILGRRCCCSVEMGKTPGTCNARSVRAAAAPSGAGGQAK